MIDRIAAFFDREGIHYVADERAVSTGFDDVAITVFASDTQLLVSARFRTPWSDAQAVNEWNASHPIPTAFLLDGELYFKRGLALGGIHDLNDDQLGFFLASSLGAIGSACEWFAKES